MSYYILAEDGQTPIQVADAMDAMRWRETHLPIDPPVAVGKTEIGVDVEVSTVFLMHDHNWGEGPPILWETLIFGGPSDGWMWRYSSHASAKAGHDLVVAALTNGTPLDDIEMPS